MRGRWTSILGFLALAAAPVFAEPRASEPASEPAVGATVSAAGEAGLVVVRDAEGNLRAPTPQELAALSFVSPVNQSDVGLREVHHANGAVSIDLQDRFQSYSMLRRGLDSSRAGVCAADLPTIAAVLLSAPDAAAPEVSSDER